ncbi:MAG: NifB/NifX family molybdenum-iron cluster-binding protein [Candidatus Methanofastidiosa archaeon]|nr:NifB/NifX family molybdenum-iron cluster-binding protein [Candidatus Methanofastidiosa archaeon]
MSILAIPLKEDKGLGSLVNEHFSRSPFFIIIDDSKATESVVENKGAFKPGHEATIELLSENKVDRILCSGMGPGAMDYAKELGMKVCFGRASTAGELLQKFRDGGLEDIVDGSPCK